MMALITIASRLPAGALRSTNPLSNIFKYVLGVCGVSISSRNYKEAAPMRILLIEDDKVVAHSIELMLKSENFNVCATDLGVEALDLGKRYEYDMILLDLKLPDISGFDVLRNLRGSKVNTPVLIVSGFANIEDKIKGLRFGADDYLTKPLHKNELIARIRAILRRAKGHVPSLIRTGDFVINLDTKKVTVKGRHLYLTNKEYETLELLAVRKQALVTKKMLLDHLYGEIPEWELKVIDNFIYKLRKKLTKASGGKNYVETVWGQGYMLREPRIQLRLPELSRNARFWELSDLRITPC
jgi:two-component system cell cycle response regulator CtrA